MNRHAVIVLLLLACIGVAVLRSTAGDIRYLSIDPRPGPSTAPDHRSTWPAVLLLGELKSNLAEIEASIQRCFERHWKEGGI